MVEVSAPYSVFAGIIWLEATIFSVVIGWNKAVIIQKIFALLSFPFPYPLARESRFLKGFLFACLYPLAFLGC